MNDVTRILIVEDKSADYDLAQREIRKSLEFCAFERVETQDAFLQALNAFEPDIILSDYNLPSFDGMKALQIAQTLAPFTPVIIWTGSISEDVAVECMRAGAANYVLKDNNKRLATAILHALEEKKLLLERNQAQAELRTVTEDLTELICRFRPDGMLTYVNQVYCDYFGKRREELIGTSFIPPNVADFSQKHIQYLKSFTPDHPINIFEQYDFLPDGSKRWREWVDRGIFDEQGKLIEIQSTGRDITDRKQAEEQLVVSEKRFRALIENGMDNISLLAADGTLLWENPAVNHTLGYGQNTFVDRNIFELMHPEDMPWTGELFTQVVQEPGSQRRGTFRLKHKDGAWRWIEATATNMLDEPSVKAIVVNYRDITERKLAEQALRENEQRYRTLFEDIPVAIWEEDFSELKKHLDSLKQQGITDFAAYFESLPHAVIECASKIRILDVNNAALQMYQAASKQELIESTYLELTEGEKQHFPEDFIAIADGKTSNSWEGSEKTLLGNPVEVSTSWSVVPGHEEDYSKVIVTTVDITQRKQSERHLRESQNKYRNLVETSHDLIWSVDADGRFTFVNSAAKDIYGYEPQELIGRFYFDIMDPQRNHLTPETFREVIADLGTYHTNEVYVRHRDGRQIILSANSMVLRDENGNVAGLTGSSRDITKQKQAEDALREERNLLRTLIDHIPDRIYAMDRQGRKTLSNTADWMASGRKTMEDVLGKTDFDLYPPELAEPFWELDKAVLDSGQPVINFEEPGLDPDGKPVSILTTKIPLRDDAGTITGLVGIGHDITERKRMEGAEREQRVLAEALRDTAQLVNSTLEYGDVLDHILAAVEQVVPHSAATIMLIDGEYAHVVRSHGYEKLGVKNEILGVRLPIADTTNLKQMLETRQPVIVRDTYTFTGWKRMEATDWLRSNVGAPISIQGEVIGFVLLDSEIPGFFNSLHAERLKAFANQAALAIHNARLLNQAKDEITERKLTEIELQHKNEDLRLLNVVNNAIVRGQNLDSIVDLLTVELKRIFSAVGSTIYMLAADKRSLTMQQYSFSPETEHKIEKLLGFKIPKIEIPIKEGGHFHNALITKQSAITSDPQKIQEWIAEFAETSALPAITRAAARRLIPHIYKLINIKSTIIVPLISHEEVIGFLDVSGPNQFTKNDLKRIEAIGEQLTALIQRQQADEKVRKSEEFLQGIQNSLSAHIAILDEHGTVIQVNEAWRAFGDQNNLRNPNYCIGMNYFAVCETATGPDTEAAQQIAVAIRQVFSGEQDEASVEYSCHSPTEKRWFTVHITCFDEGTQKWVILAHENITERKSAEIAAMESTTQFRTLFEASPDAIILIDPQNDWRIVDCNSAACKMNGYIRDELIGKPVDILNTRQDTPEQHAAYLEQVKANDVLRYETTHIHKDGTPIAIEVSTTLIRLGDRDLVLGIDRDITARKLAEQELREEQEKAQKYLDIAGVMMLALDQDGNVSLINQKGVEILGYPNEEILGKNWVNTFIPKSLRADMQEVVQKLMHGNAESPAYFENPVLTKTGEERMIAWHNTLLRDGDGRIIASLSSGEDITERKRAENELRDSEERFRQLADNIDEAFWITDALTGQEIYLSPAVEKIWGRPIRQFMGKPGAFLASVLPEDLPILTDGIERERNGEKTELEYRIVHPDGSIHWVWDRAFPLMDENGTVTKLTGISTDITQRKAVEQELRKLSLAVEQSGSTIVITDVNGNIEYVNPKFVETTGYSAEEAIGQNPRILRTGHTPPEEYKRLWTTIRSGTVWRGELYNRKKNGEFYWEQATISPIHDEHGEISHFIAVKEDITERKQTEAALLASEERYRGLFRNLVNGFALHEIVTDAQGRPVDYIFLEINPAFEKLTGLKSQDVLGRRASEIMPGIENERFIPIYGQVALTGQPVHFEDYSSALGKYFEISAYSPRPNQFATTFGDITQRRHAEDELQRHMQKTTALLDASLALTNLDLDAILQSIGYSAKGIFSADGCRIFLMQPDGQSLHCVLALQENAGTLTNLKIKLGEGVTGSVALSGQAEIVNEMHKDPRAGYIPGTAEEEEEAIIFAPIKERDRILGVLSIRRAGTERPFDTSDLELLEAFASMAASAVSNARLFEEAQQRLAELQALYENGLSVGRLLEPKEIGEHIIQTFARHLSWHHVTIRLVRPESDEMELIAFNVPGLDDEHKVEMEFHFNRMIQKSGQGLSGSVLQSGIPLRTGNVHEYPQYIDAQAGIKSGLYMPLKIGQQVIGVISVESEQPDAFTEQDQRLLATLTNQAAIAFENARLYQAAQQEISERRRAQEALWVSESHYRQLADSITDILFELDQDLRYTHWNKASEMFSGVPAEDAIGKSPRDVWGQLESLSTREDVYLSVLKERQAKTFEAEVITKGQKRILEINAYPSAHGVSVVAKDITERRLSESLLQKRFELMEYATHHSLDELMQRTIDLVSEMTESHVGFLHFVEQDQKTVKLQAWSTETIEMVGRIDEKGMHAMVDTAGVWADAVRLKESVIHNDYASMPNKKGMPLGHVPVVREMVIPILRNERVVAVLGVGNKAQEYTAHDMEIVERFADYAWDITERKQMESALAEERNQLAMRVEERTADLSRANSNLARALRVKDEFLANMSHELRTPLNAILGLSESLGEQVAGPLNEKQQKYLSTINESGHHLLSLINDILDLAKIEAGQISLDLNKVDVNSVCQASLRMIKQLAQRKNQDVNFVIDPNLGLMWADERRLKQMMVNLLSNAVKFTPESGALGLEVRGDSVANRVSISVWDRGIGISDRDLGRLFQPFVQLDAGLAREASGTGLGLALVAQMARLHGGSVAVESQQGHGSRFTILLPWEPAVAGDSSVRLRTTGKFRAIKPNEVRPTILLIEDTQEVVMMLVDYLEMAGFRMVTAQDGIDGLTQAKLAHPDLILMDIQMPRMDGFETTKRLRNDPEFRETPIIALTALAMPNDRQRCLDAGMNEYLSKPVNLKALAKTIKTFLYEAEAGSS